MHRKSRFTLVMMAVLLAFGMLGIQPAKPVLAANPLRISQVYGGGGDSGATYTNDFIEIFNSSNSAFDLTGWSVQFTTSTGSIWQITPLTGTIPASGYYLIQEGAGGGGTTPLPTPDEIGSIYLVPSNFKVALVDSTTALSGTCPTGVVDFVGTGTAACFEGTAAAPNPSITLAIVRKEGGVLIPITTVPILTHWLQPRGIPLHPQTVAVLQKSSLQNCFSLSTSKVPVITKHWKFITELELQ